MKRLGVLLLAVLISNQAWAAETIGVGLISDGELQQLQILEQQFRGELIALTDGEFQLEIKRFQGDWSAQSIAAAFDQAYADPQVDVVLAVGVTANQLGIARKQFPKPTFLPFVFDGEFMGAPIDGNSSGVANLNYLTERTDFSDELASFRRVVPFNHLTLIVDQAVLDSVTDLVPRVTGLVDDIGADLFILTHDGINHDLVSRIPADTDAVAVAGLQRMPELDFQAFIDGINGLGLPSYSLVGVNQVEQGLLASDAAPTDWQRLARRNALNMQAVLLGEKAGDQPVIFDGKRELTINLETARKIGLSPRFDVLSEAVLLNEELPAQGTQYNLSNVAYMAVEQNLDLLAESYGVAAGNEDIRSARSALLPQLSLGSSYAWRKKSPAVLAGQLAERSLDGSLNLSQILYSDDASAGLQIQRFLQEGREQSLEQLRLDIIQAATVSYLNVLRAETQLTIQQENLNLTRTNLELARDRVRLGASSRADVYRWESRIATDRSALLSARSSLDQAREALNRLLNRPITEPFQLGKARLEDPFLMTEDEFNELINNPRNLGLFVEFMVEQGMQQSPELAQLDAQIRAKEREVVNHKRAYWLPDFALSSGYSKNFEQSGITSGENLSDWNVGISASIPLFTGGERKAAASRAGLEMDQLRALRRSSEDKIEQQIRASMHGANASYANIELSRLAADSAKKNLELVTDSYTQGVVSIIDLLDAQNSSLQADEAAANSVYDFLIDIMNVQRAVGQFDFLLSQAHQDAEARKLRTYIATKGQGLNNTGANHE